MWGRTLPALTLSLWQREQNPFILCISLHHSRTPPHTASDPQFLALPQSKPHSPVPVLPLGSPSALPLGWPLPVFVSVSTFCGNRPFPAWRPPEQQTPSLGLGTEARGIALEARGSARVTALPRDILPVQLLENRVERCQGPCLGFCFLLSRQKSHKL